MTDDINEDILELFGIQEIQQPIPPDQTHISFSHAVFSDVTRMIDEYEDKWYLYTIFKHLEDNKVDRKRYEALEQLKKENDKNKILAKVSLAFDKEYQSKIDEGANERECAKKFFEQDIHRLFPELSQECIDLFECNPAYNTRKLNSEYEYLTTQIVQEEYSLSHYVQKTYNPTPDRIIKTKLRSDAYNIYNQAQLIKENSTNIHFNLSPHQYSFFVNTGDVEKSIMLETCKLLEKHYGLILNSENGLFYASDGQGKYITFDEDHDQYFYIPLRDQFIALRKKNDKVLEQPLIWSRKKFYSVGEHYSVVRRRFDYDIIGFKNCCFDIKRRIVYQLDPRFPRLPLKNCRINFVYNCDLRKRENNPLKTVFEECMTPQTREIIFKYFGRALFEQGYTHSQDVLFLMGKGGLGKTKFMEILGKIFDKKETISTDTLTPDNKFAFSSLPRADFLIMDEITNAQKHFVEKFKEMTGGSETISVEMKGKNPINLPSSLVPRMVGIGNNLIYDLYDKFCGDAVVRRFCIIFLKRSILEAKRMTRVVNDIEYPVNKDGYILTDTYTDEQGEVWGTISDDKLNKIVHPSKGTMKDVQGRTKFEIKDLESEGCLEWFIQQIILHYDGSHEPLLSYEEAKEKALMAYQPEYWSAMRWIEPIYDEEGYLDTEEYVLGTELLSRLHKDADNYLLEKVIKTPYDLELKEIIKKICGVENISKIYSISHEEHPGEIIFQGIKILDEPKPVDLDKIQVEKPK